MFGLGGGKSSNKSWSESQSDSYGYSSALSGDTARSQQRSSTTQDIAFSDLFSQLYGNASTAARSATANAGQLMRNATQLFTGGTKFLEGLGTDAGSSYMQDRLTDNDALVNDQIGMLQQDLGTLFREQLMPQITSSGVTTGNLGGSRQGVAQGLAVREVASEFARGATQLRVQNQQQKDAIAAQIAQNSLTAANTGLGALPSLLDLSERGSNAELGVYKTLASILGSPTVLSQSESAGQSMSDAFSRSFGENTATSSSKAKGTAKSFDFSLGAGVK